MYMIAQAFLSVSAIPLRTSTINYQLYKTDAKLEPFLEPSMQHILNHLQQPEKISKPINPASGKTTYLSYSGDNDSDL